MLIHESAVRSSEKEVLKKLELPWLRLNKLLRTFGALQTSRLLHIPMKAQLTHGKLLGV